MLVYTTDEDFRKQELIENYKSFIWTERYSSAGDFVLEIKKTPEIVELIQPGVPLRVDESDRVMIVKDIVIDDDEEGRTMMKVTGPSLEKILEDRVAWYYLDDLQNPTTWKSESRPENAARDTFRRVCIDKILSPYDGFKNLQLGGYKTGNIPFPNPPGRVDIHFGSLYNAIESICKTYGMGFYICLNPETLSLHFDVYMGDDRTTRQPLFDPVVMSESLGNIKSVRSLRMTSDHKNVIYVFSNRGTVKTYSFDTYSNETGYERKVTYLEVNDVPEEWTDAEVSTYLRAMGKAELDKHRDFYGVDGEIGSHTGFVYGKDYGMGDLIELQSIDGSITQMKVTEQTFVSDEEGDRSYPTLSSAVTIEPGRWGSWDRKQDWDELTTEKWEELP